jgi:hypothetical protein
VSVPATEMNAGIAGAVDQGVRLADGEDAVPEGEVEAVKKTVKEYETARAFDKTQRHRYARDRRYAAGSSNPSWASDANIIGAFIDIISSFLYAKDPDVSARPAAHVSPPPPKAPVMPPMGALPGMPAPTGPGLPAVDPMGGLPAQDPLGGLPADPMAPPPGDPMAAAVDPLAAMGAPAMPPPAAAGAEPLEQEDARRFAETSQIVISKSWKKAGLKRVMKRVLRSALSVGPGWFKSYVYSEQGRNPLVEKELSDARDNLQQIEKLQDDLTGLQPETDQALTMEKLKLQIAGLEKRVELMVKRGQCIDFLRADDVQVSLDVPTLADYRDADWISHDLYIEKDSAPARFKRIPKAEWGKATEYVQRDTAKTAQPIDGYASADTVPEGAYVKATDNVGQGAGVTGGKDSGVKFIKVVEFWDHRDMNIKTFVDGIDRWAVDPYPPAHAASRFYPFFQLALFEVDGARHPQSLVDRTWKLQDEYSSRRSSGRKTRERSIPGTVFNSSEMDVEQVQKLERSTEQEYVGIRTTTPGVDINKVIGPKPIPNIDPAIFATTDILYDMNVVTGVQEAQASGASNANTATEADIQQSGFASRTNADRDTEEDLLTEFAQYTLEIAVQGLTARDVQRLAGPYAFWPEGMDVEDILTLVEVEVEAGTTGKPRAQADKETWATLLPLIMQLVPQIRLSEQTGDLGMAETLKNILRETLKRLDDRLTIESILAPGAAPPIVPGMPPGAPATSALPGAAPPTGNGTVNNPVAQGAPPI